jgi:hypothetical protein
MERDIQKLAKKLSLLNCDLPDIPTSNETTKSTNQINYDSKQDIKLSNESKSNDISHSHVSPSSEQRTSEKNTTITENNDIDDYLNDLLEVDPSETKVDTNETEGEVTGDNVQVDTSSNLDAVGNGTTSEVVDEDDEFLR